MDVILAAFVKETGFLLEDALDVEAANTDDLVQVNLALLSLQNLGVAVDRLNRGPWSSPRS